MTAVYPSETYRLHRVSDEKGWTEVWDVTDTRKLGWVAKRPVRGQSDGPWKSYPLQAPEARHMTRHDAAMRLVRLAHGTTKDGS